MINSKQGREHVALAWNGKISNLTNAFSLRILKNLDINTSGEFFMFMK